MLEHAIAITSITGEAPRPSGARHPSIAPFKTFHAEDGLFVIAAGNDALFTQLCNTLELTLAADPRFATNLERCKNARLLKRLIEAVTIDKPAHHWIDLLTEAGIPTGPIQTVDQVLTDPQILARNMVVDVLDQNGKPTFVAAGNPIKMSALPEPKTRAPKLGEHRAELLNWFEKSS